MAALQGGQGSVFYLVLPQGAERNVARGAIREALREALSLWLGCAVDDVVLSTEAGTAVRMEHPRRTVRLSISHEDGLSVAALHPHSAIGVDVLASSAPLSAEECLTLAHDYLGPHRAVQLAAVPAEQRAQSFAADWTRWEAGLKCEGLGLSEWNEALEHQLNRCDAVELALPQGYCGAIALQRRARNVRFRPEIVHGDVDTNAQNP